VKRVYVVIVNWNGWGDTIECLESVMRLEDVHFRVVVCDNDSSDGSLEHIADWARGSLNANVSYGTPLRYRSYPPVNKPLVMEEYRRQEAEIGGRQDTDPQLVLIRTGENLGFAGGNNVGLRYVLARDDFDYVWLLNNDTVLEPEALKAMLNRMDADSSIGICGSTLLRYDSPDRIQARGGAYYCKWIGLPWHIGQLECGEDEVNEEHVERWMNYVIGASMLVSRHFLEDVGLMGEEYFLFFEETDWMRRAKGRYRLAYAKNSRVFHKVGRSIGTSSDPRKKSFCCDYYNVRNRIKFTRNVYPIALVTVYFTLFLSSLLRLFCGQWHRGIMILRLMLSGGRDLDVKP
jgi:GT2 family glycosyltransferase